MSEEPRSSKKKAKVKTKPAKTGNGAIAWVVRAIVVAVLGVLLMLAIPESRAKQAATSTAEAWRNALRSKSENADLTKSEFSKIPVKGNPVTASEKAGPNSVAAVTMETFTWKGTFRTYTVKVLFGLGNDPPVDQIEGP